MTWTKEELKQKITALQQQAQKCFNDGQQCLGAIQILQAQLADMDKPDAEPKPEPAAVAAQQPLAGAEA
jgi:hypothetical protein